VEAPFAEIRSEGMRIPVGRRVELPGRGATFVRESGADSGGPTVLLVHGWMASGGLNWAASFDPLGQRFHAVAPDLRGHGRGIRTRRRFRLEHCADDLAALVEELGCGPVIVCGYSMGGLIAQLLWRRHPDAVQGIVLCATTRVFVVGARERYVLGTSANYLAAGVRASRLWPAWHRLAGAPLAAIRPRRRAASVSRWAMAEIRRHDARQMIEAVHASSHFDSRAWVGDIDVPTAVVVTTRDRAIPPKEQGKLAAAIPGATIHEVDDDHDACAHPSFASALVDACLDVSSRVPPA